MSLFFLIFSVLLIVLSILPFIRSQHWVFRVPEFIKIQLLIAQLIAMAGLIIFTEKNLLFWLVGLSQTALIFFNLSLLVRFTKFYKNKKPIEAPKGVKSVKVISTNIYQFNKDFERFIKFIRREQPDIFLTIESNKDWELAMRDLEAEYPHTQKITLENTYGMHLYAKKPFQKVTTHYFVADDIPSIEAHFKTENGEDFVLFCVHPPPPSPTEEETSKERDGDLLCIAKRVKEIDKPILVIGDFNTVAWSKISDLFRKNSELIDGRIGRGILASYHAKYWFFRTPLDLVFHSSTIFLKRLRVLENIGSDHFPIECTFYLDTSNSTQEEREESFRGEKKGETSELIQEGKEEKSDNRD